MFLTAQDLEGGRKEGLSGVLCIQVITEKGYSSSTQVPNYLAILSPINYNLLIHFITCLYRENTSFV